MFDFITLDETLEAMTRDWSFAGLNRQNTDRGRLWLRTIDNVGTVTIEVFRRPERTSQDLVASGSGALGLIALTQANSSGLSGSVELLEARTADAALVAFYACDDDLDLYEENLASLLDVSGNYAGADGFSRLTGMAKRRIDDLILTRVRREGLHDLSRSRVLSSLIDPSELMEPAALLALALVFERLAGAPDREANARSASFVARFDRALGSARIRLDLTSSGTSSLTLLFGDMSASRS